MKDFYTEARYLRDDLASFVELVEAKRFDMARSRLKAMAMDLEYLASHVEIMADESRLIVIEVK